MFKSLEKESSSSVFFSGLGAWLGVGSGLSLLISSWLACSQYLLLQERHFGKETSLAQSLDRDLSAVSPQSVKVLAEGKSLEMSVPGPQAETKITYTCQDDMLYRKTGQDQKKASLGLYPSLRFQAMKTTIVATWDSDGKRQRVVGGWQR